MKTVGSDAGRISGGIGRRGFMFSRDARVHRNQEPRRSSAIVLASGGKAGLRGPRASKELVEIEDAIDGLPKRRVHADALERYGHGCRKLHHDPRQI